MVLIFSQTTVLSQGNMAKNNAIINLTIHSTVLQRDQHIQVYLPEDYSTTSRSYPVLYILDGQHYFYYGVAFQQTSKWRYRSPEFIVAGITTKNKQLRRLDFGSELRFLKYRDFLEKELLPHIEKNYRVSDDRMIFGWQSPGYCVIQVLLERPELFSAYFVASAASVDSIKFEQFARRSLNSEKFLYFARSPDETWLTKVFTKSTALLQKKAPKNLRWKSELFVEEDHWSTPYRTIYRGLTEYYYDYQPLLFESLQDYENAGGIQHLINHYQRRGEKYNVSHEIHPSTIFNLLSLSMRADNYESFDFFMTYFTGEIPGLYPVRWHHRYGQFYLKHEKLQKAQSFFKEALQAMPNSPLLYAGLGDVYQKLGEKQQAEEAYQKAIDLAQKIEDPGLENYKDKLIKLKTNE